jgi:hypothetical protein
MRQRARLVDVDLMLDALDSGRTNVISSPIFAPMPL